MPNVKIYVDADIYDIHKIALSQTLLSLRGIVVSHLKVPESACQFALVPVGALKDQPAVNVEMHIMPHSDRTQEALVTMGRAIQRALHEVIGAPVAFRCTQLDPATYVALK
jgi:hypothetical protein